MMWATNHGARAHKLIVFFEFSSFSERTEDEAAEFFRKLERLKHLELHITYITSDAQEESLKNFMMGALSVTSLTHLSLDRVPCLIGISLASDTLEHLIIDLHWNGGGILDSLSTISRLKTLTIGRYTDVAKVGAMKLAHLAHLRKVMLENVRPTEIALPDECELTISCTSSDTDEKAEWGDDPVWNQVSRQLTDVRMNPGAAVWVPPAVLSMQTALRDVNIRLKGGRGHRVPVLLGGALASAERCTITLENVSIIVPSVGWTRFAICRGDTCFDPVVINFKAGCNPGAAWWLRSQKGVSRIELGEKWCDGVWMQQSSLVLRHTDTLCSGNVLA